MNNYSQIIHIAGAGIMGLLTAHALRETSPDKLVSVCDGKGFPPKNASTMAGGMLSPYSEIEHLPSNYISAAFEGLNFWKKLAKEKPSIEFKNTGSLITCHPSDQHMLNRFENLLKANNLQYDTLDRLQLHSIEPNSLFPNIEQAIFISQEAHLNPQAAINTLINMQIPRIAEDFDFQNLDTKFGDCCDWVIDCRGIASDDKDLRGVKGETLLVYNPDFHLTRPVRIMHPRYPLYIVPRPGNIFMVGATLIESSNNTNVSIRSAMELMSALHIISPSFKDATIVDMKAGIRPSYPDNLPRITINGNTISCNGLFRHGYLLAPVMAQCVADYLAGKENEFMPLFIKERNNESHNQRAA